MKIRRRHALPAIGALAVLCTGGCSDSPTQSGAIPTGRIEGYVRTAVPPVDARVFATLVADRPGDAARFDVDVAPSGYYTLDVPAGRYVVGVSLRYRDEPEYQYSAGGLDLGPPDTLRVDAAHSPLQVDFDLATLELHLDLSPELDGQDVYVFMHRMAPPAPSPRQQSLLQHRAEIQNGAIELLVPAVLPGAYKFEVELYRNGERFWFPGVRDPAASPSVDVLALTVTRVVGGVDPNPARIQGRITGAWEELEIGAPALGLYAVDSTIVRGLRAVREDGTFDEAIYVPAPIKLLVSHGGMTQWVGGSTFDAATVFDLRSGQTISGIEFVESGAEIEVTGEGDSFGSTSFRFYDATTMALAAEWWGYVSSASRLRVPNLRPGSYRLRIDFSSRAYTAWTPQWYDRAMDPMSARVVTIASAGEVVRIPVVMETGATISGTVTGAVAAADYVRVYVTRADDPSGWSDLLVLGRSFTLQGFPNGHWKVGAYRRDGNNPNLETPDTVWYPGTTNWWFAQAITVRHLEDVSGIEIPLPAPPR